MIQEEVVGLVHLPVDMIVGLVVLLDNREVVMVGVEAVLPRLLLR